MGPYLPRLSPGLALVLEVAPIRPRQQSFLSLLHLMCVRASTVAPPKIHCTNGCWGYFVLRASAPAWGINPQTGFPRMHDIRGTTELHPYAICIFEAPGAGVPMLLLSKFLRFDEVQKHQYQQILFLSLVVSSPTAALSLLSLLTR